MVSGSISLPSSGFFSPFPHGTGSLSVSWEYLALPDGPGRFTQDSTCPALLRRPLHRINIMVRGFHPLWPNFPERSLILQRMITWSYNPAIAATTAVWALPRSLATTGGIINLFSFPPGIKMFQFPGLASIACAIDERSSTARVVPFGNPRVKGYLRLTAAYRSLSRPSSPARAKASAVRPSILSRSTTTLECCCSSYFQLYSCP